MCSIRSDAVGGTSLLQWEEAMRVGGGYADGYVDYRKRCQKQSTLLGGRMSYSIFLYESRIGGGLLIDDSKSQHH